MSDAATRAQALNELGRGEQALAIVAAALADSPQDVGLLVQAAVALIDRGPGHPIGPVGRERARPGRSLRRGAG